MTTISKKICLIGDFSVGKTSLIRRFVDRQFSDQYLSTVGVKISRKAVQLTDKGSSEPIQVQLLIWDIEGQTKFKAIAPTYLQGAAGVIIVCDVTRPETIENVQGHIKLFESVNPKGVSLVAFNKTDLLEEEKREKLLEENNLQDFPQVIATYTTSAKTGKDVDKMFNTLSSNILV
ncbi:MAG: Rab family GTPase [Spirulinaceae cyanobacterium]